MAYFENTEKYATQLTEEVGPGPWDLVNNYAAQPVVDALFVQPCRTFLTYYPTNAIGK